MLWDDMLQSLLPYVKGCSDQLAIDHLKKAAREFCALTRLWQVETSPVKTGVGKTVYPLDLDEGQERMRVMEAWLDGSEMTVLNATEGRLLARRNAGGRFVYLEGPLDFVVYPAPALANQQIVLTLAVQPSMTADEWPDDFTEHATDIAHGAISSLSMIPRTQFFDRQVAMDHRQIFLANAAAASIVIANGYVTAKTGRRRRSNFL